MTKFVVIIINLLAKLFSSIALYFGRTLRFKTYEDCVSCVYYMARNVGLPILDRQDNNGRVRFKAKIFTWKEYCSIFGLMATLIVNTIIFVKIHYKPNMALHELVWLIFYIFLWIFSMIMVVEFVRHKKLLNIFGPLHDEADLAIAQLGIHFDYRFAIVTMILLQGLAYMNWIFIVICFWIIRSVSIYDQINFSIVFFIFIMLVTTSLILSGGHIFICSARFILLNRFVENEINELDDDDIIYDEENQWNNSTFNSVEITAKLRIISDIHMKHYELTKATMMFSSVFLIGFVHMVVALSAIILYFYFFKKVLLIELLLIDVTALVVSIFLAICGEVLKRQAKYTLTLMADWCMCFYDPAMISIRSAILLQASHENFQPEPGGAIPMDTRMLIFIVEISIAVVVFFIQFSV